jgi:hypothetical protein
MRLFNKTLIDKANIYSRNMSCNNINRLYKKLAVFEAETSLLGVAETPIRSMHFVEKALFKNNWNVLI